MKLTEQILSQILDSSSTKIFDLYTEKKSLPKGFDDFQIAKNDWLPHPPVMIPVFINPYSPFIIGCFYHHFTDKKRMSYAEYHLEDDYMSEFALTSDQFISNILLRSIEVEGKLEPSFIEFAESLDYKFLGEFMNFDYDKFLTNPRSNIVFESNTPFELCKHIDEYQGDFLSTYILFSGKRILFNELVLDHSCDFELVDLDVLSSVEKIPNWYKKEIDKHDLFNEYMDRNDIGKAWLTLNSHGWKLHQIESALLKMKHNTADELFHLVADNWIDGYRNSSYEPNYQL